MNGTTVLKQLKHLHCSPYLRYPRTVVYSCRVQPDSGRKSHSPCQLSYNHTSWCCSYPGKCSAGRHRCRAWRLDWTCQRMSPPMWSSLWDGSVAPGGMRSYSSKFSPSTRRNEIYNCLIGYVVASILLKVEISSIKLRIVSDQTKFCHWLTVRSTPLYFSLFRIKESPPYIIIWLVEDYADFHTYFDGYWPWTGMSGKLRGGICSIMGHGSDLNKKIYLTQ